MSEGGSGSGGAPLGTGGGSSVVIGGSGGAGGGVPCQVTSCQRETYACGDCLDNDGDGLIDSLDPECLGPCDNTEDSFYDRGVDATESACKQDCYFDQNSGSGNDGCYWSLSCDALYAEDANCPYAQYASVPGTSLGCAELATGQSQACRDFCLPLTPHGCDCFGCCELPAGSGRYVWIGSNVDGVGSCDLVSVGNPAFCHPCTPVFSCLNPCTACQVCIGRPSPDPSCNPQCPSGQAPCGLAGQAPCGEFQYCVSGCCQPAPA